MLHSYALKQHDRRDPQLYQKLSREGSGRLYLF
jgi:hypothetical protein